MGFLDKVKEKASDALETGKDVAQTQQLKLQLRKLEGEVEAAQRRVRRGRVRPDESGTLATSGDLGALAARVREARAAVDAKRAEITNAGGDHDDDDGRRSARTATTSQS